MFVTQRLITNLKFGKWEMLCQLKSIVFTRPNTYLNFFFHSSEIQF